MRSIIATFSLAVVGSVSFGTVGAAQSTEEKLLEEVRLLTPANVERLIERAKAGDAEAQLQAGVAYKHGYVVQVAPREARDWFQKAAEQGVIPAQYLLGTMLLRGQEIPQDLPGAARWIHAAADNDHAEAQYEYGMMLFDGVGVAQDHQRAFEWFSRAAGQGSVGAQTYVGIMYTNGLGVAQDIGVGMARLREAAERGSPMAQANLGAMYANGFGVAKDPKEALVLFFMADAGGFEGVQGLIDELETQMPDADVATAKREADDRYQAFLGGPPPTQTGPSSPPSPLEPPQRPLEEVDSWIEANLARMGTFSLRLSDDWAESMLSVTGERPNVSLGTVKARHQVMDVGYDDCTLRYEVRFFIDAVGVEIPLIWILPLASVDLSSIKVQPYELPLELRAASPAWEVFMRSKSGQILLVIDGDDIRRSALQHGFGTESRRDALELADVLRDAVRHCVDQ